MKPDELAARGVAELLLCPFCGGEAESDFHQPYRNISTGKLADAVAIYCTICDANMSLCREDHPGADPDDLMAELVAAWNRRATPTALAASPEVAVLIRRFERIADEIDEQVAVTRAYVADSGMDHNQRELMKICTSHFLDKARAIRAEAAALRGKGG